MGSAVIIAAAVAAQAVHASIQRQQAHYRRAAEERRRREEENYREEQRRRREKEERRREEERRQREVDSRKRRFNNKLKKEGQTSEGKFDVSSLEFTDKLVVSKDFFPTKISETEFEIKYADGSYATFDKEEVLKENYSGQYRMDTCRSYSMHLSNGATRTYIYDGYGDGKYHLIREELPDGRMKTYDFDQNLLFERDAEGNYKLYKHLDYTKEIVLREAGTINGWFKRYEYKEGYNGKEYVVTETEEKMNEAYSDKQNMEFTNKLVVSEEFFPSKINKAEFEIKYADGSYATSDKEEVLKKNYSNEYRMEKCCSHSIHLSNGVTRTYVYDDYGDRKYHLIREELPDGRMKTYDFDQNLLFERDAEGNYKLYKHLDYTKDIVLREVGTINEWSKRYDYQERYNGKKYVVAEIKELSSDGSYQIFDEIEHFLKEEKDDKDNVHKWSERGKLLEEALADGTTYRWNEFEVMTFEKLPTGEETHWNNQGIKIYEAFPSGETREWNDKGTLVYEKLAAQEERRWNEKGKLVYEKTAEGNINEWSNKGHKIREVLADGSETRWYTDTDKVSYKRDADQSFKEFDELGRVVREGKLETSYAYRYYGDTEQLLDKRTLHGYGSEDKSAYEHYDKKGKVNTTHYKALKKIAKERMKEEDEISKKKGKKTILPKMSSLKKAVVYRQNIRKIEKEK